MMPYGVRRRDAGCCPGHDKYPSEPYKVKQRRSFKREDRPRKKAARRLIIREEY